MFAIARTPTAQGANPLPKASLHGIGSDGHPAQRNLTAPNVVLFGDDMKVRVSHAFADVTDSIRILYDGSVDRSTLGSQLRSFRRKQTEETTFEFQTTRHWIPFLRYHYTDKLEWPALNELFKINLDLFQPDSCQSDIPDTALWYCLAHLSSLFFHSNGAGGLRPWTSSVPFAGSAYRAGWAHILHPLGKAISDLAQKGKKENASFLINCLNCLQLIEVFKDLSFDLDIEATRRALSDKDRDVSIDLSVRVNTIDLFDETRQHLTRILQSTSTAPTDANELNEVLCKIETLLTHAMCFKTIQYAFGGSTAELTAEKSALLGLIGATFSSVSDASWRMDQEANDFQTCFSGSKPYGEIAKGIEAGSALILKIFDDITVAEDYLLNCRTDSLRDNAGTRIDGIIGAIRQFAPVPAQTTNPRSGQAEQLSRIKLGAICFGVDILVTALQACFNNIAAGKNAHENWLTHQQFVRLHGILSCEINRLADAAMRTQARQIRKCLDQLLRVVTRFFDDVSSMAVVLSVRDLVDITGEVWSLFRDPHLKKNIREALASIAITDMDAQSEAERKTLEATATLALRNLTKALIAGAAKATGERRLPGFDTGKSITPPSTRLQIMDSDLTPAMTAQKSADRMAEQPLPADPASAPDPVGQVETRLSALVKQIALLRYNLRQHRASHARVQAELELTETCARNVERQKLNIQNYVNVTPFADLAGSSMIDNLDAYAYFDLYRTVDLADADFGHNQADRDWYANLRRAIEKIGDTDRLGLEKRLKSYIAVKLATGGDCRKSDIEFICQKSGFTVQKPGWWAVLLQIVVSRISFNFLSYTPPLTVGYIKATVQTDRSIPLHSTPYSQLPDKIDRLKTSVKSLGVTIETIDTRILQAESELKVLEEQLVQTKTTDCFAPLVQDPNPVDTGVNTALMQRAAGRNGSRSFWGVATLFK